MSKKRLRRDRLPGISHWFCKRHPDGFLVYALTSTDVRSRILYCRKCAMERLEKTRAEARSLADYWAGK